MSSEAQSAANRQNAKKGGVKTDEGKAVSRLNALKHGILSKHLFISTGSKVTDYEEFESVRDIFFEEMQPIGILETLLVDRLFATFWRIQRLHVAETGFIRKQTEEAMRLSVDRFEELGNARKDSEKGFFRQMRTSEGCANLAMLWQAVAESLKEKGLPLSKGMTRAVDEEMGGKSGFFMAEYVSQFNWIVENNGGALPMTDEFRQNLNVEALRFAEELVAFFTGMSEHHEWHEKDVSKADLESKLIPPLDQLDKIQRYDAHLQRLLIQTLHELQRVQAARQGKSVPLAAAVDVTVNAENGFVS